MTTLLSLVVFILFDGFVLLSPSSGSPFLTSRGPVTTPVTTPLPKKTKTNRREAFRNGIPFRPNGLFPLGDPLLAQLSNDATLRPFQKNIAVAVPGAGGDEAEEEEDYRLHYIVADSWATGDVAAANGLDLRYFYRDETEAGGVKFGELVAVFRMGDRAGIGHKMYTNAHGGCIETVLDEMTAEIVKVAVEPNIATVDIQVKIKKPVSLNHTYSGRAVITRSTSLRVYTSATIVDPVDGTVIATAEACLANLREIAKASAGVKAK